MLVGRSSELLRDHPGWVVRDPAGEPVSAGHVCRQECTALDVTHPDAAAYLSGVLRTMRAGASTTSRSTSFTRAPRGAPAPGRHRGAGLPARAAADPGRDRPGRAAARLRGADPALGGPGRRDAGRPGHRHRLRAGRAATRPSHRSRTRPGTRWPGPGSRAGSGSTTRTACWPGPACSAARTGPRLVERFGGLRSSGDGLRNLDAWGLATTRRLLVPSPAGPVT